MKRKRWVLGMLVMLLIAGTLIYCTPKPAQQNFLFDMGSSSSPVAQGYTQITPETIYSKQRGFGWLQQPIAAFDSLFKWNNELNRDGVRGRDSVSFRIDVPDGDYFLGLVLGDNLEDKMQMFVSLNGKRISDTINTPYYRIRYRSFTKKVHLKSGAAIISVNSPNGKIALQSIALRPVNSEADYSLPKGLSSDTALIKKEELKLVTKLQSDPQNVALTNQLDDIRTYLKACYYYDLGAWASSAKKAGANFSVRMYMAADMLQQLTINTASPLYERAMYLLGKIHYWINQEDYDNYNSAQYKACFSLLKDKYPDNDTLQMYLGKKIRFNIDHQPSVAGAPQWAVYQNEAMQRMLKVIYWWVKQRQIANGELGGKYGDDVEILRWWLPAIVGADDSIAKKGYLRLADGVWNSGILENGYAKQIDDVEHSAELFRDTHPAVFMIDYGNPEYVERCLISMQNFRDTWSGITPTGHRHFKSFYLSAKAVSTKPEDALDVPLNARAAMPGLWALWYNRNPTLLKLFTGWSDAWVADAQRTDGGKPAGILPASVGFKDDRIGANIGKWYDSGLPYDYYKWESLSHINELQEQLIGLYAITKNEKYLLPLNRCYQLMVEGGKETLPAKPEPGSLPWVKKVLLADGADDNEMAGVFAMAKQVTGSKKYDALVQQLGSPYNQFQINGDVPAMNKNFTQVLSSLRYNFPLLTSEVKYTDRVYVPGTDLLLGMYTGQFGSGFEYPSQVVTWKNTGRDMTVFVRKGDHRSASISLFNFGDSRTVTMNTWMLAPGTYKLTAGFDSNDDGVIDEVKEERQLALNERVNPVKLTIPAKRNYVVHLEQVVAFAPLNSVLPDLALSARDIKVTKQGIAITIHNIGNVKAANCRVVVWLDGKQIGTYNIKEIEAPNDLIPRFETIHVKWSITAGQHQVKVRVSGNKPEITTLNNEAAITAALVK